MTTYDPKLATALAAVDVGQPMPTLWKEFDALANVPVMVVRGANSDILSETTVAQMRARHPALAVLEVPDQGHAPLLVDLDTIAANRGVYEACEPQNAVHKRY